MHNIHYRIKFSLIFKNLNLNITIVQEQNKPIYIYLYLIPMCRTEFGKKNPINVWTKMAMELNIDVGLFKIFRLNKKMVNEKNKLLE